MQTMPYMLDVSVGWCLCSVSAYKRHRICDACCGSSIHKLEEERLENQATLFYLALMCNIDVDVHVN